MSRKFETVVSNKPAANKSLQSYVMGFGLSVALTLAAFAITLKHVDSDHSWGNHDYLVLIIMILAFVQLVVQLVFFLHLQREPKPRLQSIVFVYTAVIIAVLVAGTLWIMANLDYRHGSSGHNNMNSSQHDKEMIEDEGIYR